MANVCGGCGSARLEEGSIVSAGVQLDRASTLKKILAAPELKIVACLDCGRVDGLRADPERLRALVGA